MDPALRGVAARLPREVQVARRLARARRLAQLWHATYDVEVAAEEAAGEEGMFCFVVSLFCFLLEDLVSFSWKSLYLYPLSH